MTNVRSIVEDYLDRGTIIVVIDSSVKDVVLPDHLMNSKEVKLNLSYRFQTNIFEIDDEKIIVDLSFKGTRVVCVIPFRSIYYIANLEDQLNGVDIIENNPFYM